MNGVLGTRHEVLQFDVGAPIGVHWSLVQRTFGEAHTHVRARKG